MFGNPSTKRVFGQPFLILLRRKSTKQAILLLSLFILLYSIGLLASLIQSFETYLLMSDYNLHYAISVVTEEGWL